VSPRRTATTIEGLFPGKLFVGLVDAAGTERVLLALTLRVEHQAQSIECQASGMELECRSKRRAPSVERQAHRASSVECQTSGIEHSNVDCRGSASSWCSGRLKQ
jgi:hypothetical protein